MRFQSTFAALTGVILFGGALAGAQETELEKTQRENRNLERRIVYLNKSLSAALEREQTKTSALKEIKQHLALFGKNSFEGADVKIRDAVTDLQIAKENLSEIEGATSDLLPLIKNYLRTAVASDPEARMAVEVKIRELEVALGQRKQPKRKVEQGTAQEARIVTVDSTTGLVVVNAGHDAELAVGMQFRIERTGTHLGDAIVAATRADVSGLLMQSLKDPNNQVRPGDTAKLILQ